MRVTLLICTELGSDAIFITKIASYGILNDLANLTMSTMGACDIDLILTRRVIPLYTALCKTIRG